MNQIDTNSIDTIFTPISSVSHNEIQSIESIFTKHSLPHEQLKLIPLESPNNSWIFYWLLGVGIVLLIGKLAFPKRWYQSVVSLFSVRAFNALRSEGLIIKHILNILLIIIYVFSLSLLISIFSTYYILDFTTPSWDIYNILGFSVIIFVLILIKLLFISITQFFYDAKEAASQYTNYLSLSYGIMGMGIFIGLWIIIYIQLDLGLYFTAAFVVAVFLVRLYKLLSITESKNNFSLFNFIVYICTVEILPLIIAQKLYFYWLLSQ